MPRAKSLQAEMWVKFKPKYIITIPDDLITAKHDLGEKYLLGLFYFQAGADTKPLFFRHWSLTN
jgi:hypothetical protein